MNESQKDKSKEIGKDITNLDSKNTDEKTIIIILKKENKINFNLNENLLVISGNLPSISQYNLKENDENDEINFKELEKTITGTSNKVLLNAIKILQKKVNKLGKKQSLIFHQISQFHNCRDISKSILLLLSIYHKTR